ncbi:translocation/assembly module TamB domain-containing protein [Candidatus Poribacteria bacterium]|nr:translocation/assembly module TamB domain-containing protein [Candidatus Poribacteria bacterium]
MKLKHPRLIITISSILLISLVAFYLLMQSNFMLEKARGIMLSQLQRRLDADVYIGPLSGNLLRYIIVGGIRIRDKRGKPLISAGNVLVDYRLIGLLRGKLVLSKIQLASARIRLEVDRNGRINLIEIYKRKRKIRLPPLLVSTVVIKDSLISVDDRMHDIKGSVSDMTLLIKRGLMGRQYSGELDIRSGRISLGGKMRRLSDIRASFKIRSSNWRILPSNMAMSIDLLEMKLGGSSIRIKGELPDLRTLSFNGDIDSSLKLQDLSPFLTRLGLPPTIGEMRGSLSLAVTASGKPKSFSGKIRLKGRGIQLQRIKADLLDIDGQFTSKSADLDLLLQANGGKIEGPMKVNLSNGKPLVDGKLRVENLNLPPLRGVEGCVSGEISLHGSSLMDALVESKLQAKAFKLNGIDLSPTAFHLSLRRGEIEGKGEFAGSTASLSGRIGDNGSRIRLDVSISSDQIAPIASIIGLKGFSGKGDIELSLEGPTRSPGMRIAGEIDQLKYRRFPLGRAKLDLNGTIDALKLARLELKYGDMTAAVQGEIRHLSTVVLQVRFHRAPLGDYAKVILPQINVVGYADGEGEIHGRAGSPDGEIDISLSHLTAYGLPFQPSTFKLRFQSGGIIIPDLEMMSSAGPIHAKVEISPDGHLHIEGEAGPMRLSDLVRSRGLSLPMTGEISASFRGGELPGRPFDLTSRIGVKGMRYRGRSLGDMVMKLKMTGKELRIGLDGFDGTVRGEMLFSDGGADLDLSLSDLNISPFLPSPYSGRLRAAVKLGLREPSLWGLNGSVRIDSLSISSPSGRMETVARSVLTFNNGVIGIKGFRMARDNGGRLRIAGRLSRDSSELAVSLSHFDIGMLTSELNGDLNMDLKLSGRLNSPLISLSLSSPELRVMRCDGIKLENVDLESELRDGVMLIRKLRFSLPGGGYTMSGEVPIDLDLERFSLNLPDERMDLEFQAEMASTVLDGIASGFQLIGGKLRVSGSVVGTSSSPKLHSKLNLDGVRVKPKAIPYMTSSFSGDMGISFDLISRSLKTDVDGNLRCDLLRGEIKVKGGLQAVGIRPFKPQFSFDLTCRSAEIAPLIRKLTSRSDLPLEVDIEDLRAQVGGQGLKLSGISADISFLTSLSLADEKMRSTSRLGIQMRDGRIEIQPFELRGDNSSIGLSGWLDSEERVQLAADIRLPMNSISPFLYGDERWGGDLKLTLKGDGTLTSPSLKFSCLIDRFSSGNVKFEPTISLRADYSNDLLTISDLSVRLGVGRGANLIGVSGKLPIHLDLRSRRFTFNDEPLTISAKGKLDDLSLLSSLSTSILEIKGKTDFNLTLEGSPSKIAPKGDISVQIGRLVLSQIVKPIESLTMRIHAETGSLRIEPVDLAIGEGEITAKIGCSLDGIRPTVMKANLDFKGIRIEDLKRLGYRDILRVRGSVSGGADMRSDISSLSPPWRMGTFGYLKGILAKANGLLSIDELRLLLNDQELRPTGKIVGVLSNGVFDLRSFRMTPYPRNSSSTVLAAMMLWEVGRSLSISASGLFDLSLIPTLSDLSGAAHFSFSLGGTEDEPTFELSWGPDKLTVKRAKLSDVSGRIRYAKGKILVERAGISIGGSRITATGYIPARFELPYFRMSYPDEKMEISVDGRISSLDFIPLILQDVVSAQGRGNVSLTVGGTLGSPTLSGMAEFKSLSLQYLPSAIYLKETELTAVFNGQSLIIDHMSGLLNDGTYAVSGRVTFKGFKPESLDINGSWNSSLFYQPSLYTLRCSGDVSLKGSFQLPLLTGTVTIDEFRYSRPWNDILASALSPSPETRAIVIFNSPLLRGMELDLDVQAPGRVLVDAGIASVEVSFNGKVRGPLNRFIFVGESSIVSGELVYLNHKFKIVEGHIENIDRFRFNPKYVIVAETERPIRGVSLQDVDGNLRVRDIDVTITLSGTLDQPSPPILSARVLNAEPGEEYELDSEDIISILTTGRTGSFTFAQVGELSYAAADIFRRGAESYLGGFVARLLGFKEFEIEFAPSDIEETKLLFTKEFSPRWSLTYSSTLQLHSEPRIEVEYQINDHLAITGERTEQGKYGIDLKLEYEFK